MVTSVTVGLSGPGLSPRQERCAVFFGKTFSTHSASLWPGVWKYNGYQQI